MNDVENGMLIGAEAEWECMCAETPWERRTDESILAFVYEEDMAGKIIMAWLDTQDCDEDAAWMLFERLTKPEQVRLVEWFMDGKRGLISMYNNALKEVR